MLAADRRMGIVSILVACGHATTRELAQEFGVSRRTIMHDISHLSYGYPIYTKQGAGGGVFIMEGQDSRKLTGGTGNNGNVTPPTAPIGTAKKTLKCGAKI